MDKFVKNISPYNFLKSVDTITTKLLTLVLFITVIPLVVVANFSTGIISQSLLDSSKNELDLNIKIFREKYLDELNELKLLSIQAVNGYIEDSYAKYTTNSDHKSLIHNLAVLQKSLKLDLCILADKNNKIIADTNGGNIKEIKGILSTLTKNALAGKTIVTTEVIPQSDFIFDKHEKPVTGNLNSSNLVQIVMIPISYKKDQISAVLVVGKNLNNNNIPALIKSLTGATLSIYQIAEKESKIIVTNNIMPAKGIDDSVSRVLNYIRSGESVVIKESFISGAEIGKYEPVKNYFGDTIGAVYIGIQESRFVDPVGKNVKFISIISVISLLVAIAIAALFSRTITTPILKLVSAAKSIASGDLNQRVKINGNDEISQLSATFNRMANNLQKQEQLKDNFVATLTHDLKVPMLAENQTINYMLKEVYGPVTNEQKEVLELIKSTNNSSLEMVGTLLEVYRYDTGNVQLVRSSFDIVKLFTETINQISTLALDKKIEISFSSTPEEILINADEREIKRVLHNLISNAINSGIYNGHIHCNIELISNKNKIYQPDFSKNTTLKHKIDISDSVLVSIADDGVGISKEDMSELFKRFSFSKGRKPAGTGLGLYYSYQVIKQHNGYIWAESAEGRGSKFIFKLPREIC